MDKREEAARALYEAHWTPTSLPQSWESLDSRYKSGYYKKVDVVIACIAGATEMTDTNIGFGGDYLKPDWENTSRVHDWRNYITDQMKSQWDKFSSEQKRMIAEMADEAASGEQWD